MRIDLVKLVLGDDRFVLCRIDKPVEAELADIDRIVQNILHRRLAPLMIVLRFHPQMIQLIRDPRGRKMSFRFPVKHHLDICGLALVNCKRIMRVDVTERGRIGVITVFGHMTP